MDRNDYDALVEKLAEEIVEGVMDKEAGVGDKYFDKILREEAEKNPHLWVKERPRVKGAYEKATDSMKNMRDNVYNKTRDAARRVKDTKAYGAARGMLGTKKGKAAAGALVAAMGVGGYAGMKMKHKRSEGSKAAYEINDFIEKVADYNGMDFDVTADILERAASAYQEALYGYEDSQIRKVAAGEVYEEADYDEVEAAAQLEAAVQVLEEMGVPVDELLGEDDDE